MSQKFVSKRETFVAIRPAYFSIVTLDQKFIKAKRLIVSFM